MTNWREIRSKVDAKARAVSRDPSTIQILAVSKTQPVKRVLEAYQDGARSFGENYVQEALKKIKHLQSQMPEAKWHFIGSLQSNKAKMVAGEFALIHSLDRWSLVEALDKIKKSRNQSSPCLIEVNIGRESSKSGVDPDELVSFAERISKETELEVHGLMSFPPLCENPEDSRKFFRKTRELFEELRDLKLPRISMYELSMGITSDFEVAIEEGATILRMGTAIFGPRGTSV